jgi:selenocysteine lyase/cysteine desulfurase
MTNISRRNVLIAAGLTSAATTLPAVAQSPAPIALPKSLPDKVNFDQGDGIYLDSGSQHPMSLGARAAVEDYFNKRMQPGKPHKSLEDSDVLGKFARLINADKDEIALVQSTTAGEQMVIRGLGLPQQGAHIVSDTLHFFGSLPTYEELARQGCEVTWVRDKDGRIPLEDMKRAIRKDTKLVALSLVSTINGFEHDLKAVCDIAHANGALVYADIIHAAGCVPVDVKASGVDFAACASYKWLMGDFGLGFIYARKDVQNRLVRREYGYEGIAKFDPHIYPFDPPGSDIVDYAWADDAEGRFAHGTDAFSVMAQLDYSLDYIAAVGVPAIQAHAQKLTSHLKRELPRLGYQMMTPPETATPLVACALENAREKLRARMAAANVTLTTSKNRFRLSPSVFNDENDIEKFLSALGY